MVSINNKTEGKGMHLKKILFIACIFCLIMTISESLYAKTDKQLYLDAYSAAKRGEIDAAFMSYHGILRFAESSNFYDKALFATGEYYFSIHNMYDAESTLIKFISRQGVSDALPFALAYLLNIRKNEGDFESVELIQKRIVELEQLSLLFSEYKEVKYISPLRKNYKAVYFIDRIEFYINGALFETIQF